MTPKVLMAAAALAASAHTHAAVESSSGFWTATGFQDLVMSSGDGQTVATGRSFSEPGSPTQGLIDGGAGSSANGLTGRLRGGSAVYSLVSGDQSPADSSFYSYASITDQLAWNGGSPLKILLDVDWSWFSAQALAPDYGMPGLANTANAWMQLGYYVSYDDPLLGETMLARRTLLRQTFHHSDGTREDQAVDHRNGIDQLVSIGGSSYLLDAQIDALGFDPGLVDVTFTLGVGTGCGFVAGAVVNHSANCAAQVDLWGTAYAGIQGDFQSVSGYSYRGREGTPPTAMPEPSALALALTALVAVRRRR